MSKRIQLGKKAYLRMPVEVKSIDKEAGTLEAIFSTQDIDRHGDIVLQEGWDLKNFKKNPVILDSHNYESAAEVIGKASNVRIEGKKLIGKITFAVNENPKAKVIFDLYAGGFLSAFSVGFIVSKFKENKDGSIDWYTIEEAELLEVSAVSVPANARALAKRKGIDIDILEETNEENNDDEDNEPEPGTDVDTDEVPEDTQVPPTDEDGTTDEGDDSEGEPDESEKDGGQDEVTAEPEATDTDTEEEDSDTPEQPAVAPKSISKNARLLKAIREIEDQEQAVLRKVAQLVKQLMEKDESKVAKETKEQIRKRKINQAIRALMKVK